MSEETSVAETTTAGSQSDVTVTSEVNATKQETSTETPTVVAPPEPQSWEGFEFKAPEGSDKQTITSYGEIVKEVFGATPDKAQEALDQLLPKLEERRLKQLNGWHEQLIEQSKADKLIGGDKFEKNMAIAKKASDAFGDAELIDLLKPVSEGGQGLGNHPVINRLLYRVGLAMKPDDSMPKGRPEPLKDQGDAEVLFGDMFKK